MRKIIFLLFSTLLLLTMSSCSGTSTYQSTNPNSVWLKVECDNSAKTYTMWMALPSSGQWGDPIAKGTFTEEEANDTSTGHLTKTFKFHHNENGQTDDGKGIGSISLNSTLKEVFGAIKTSLNTAIGEAVSHDMLELVVDEKTERGEFRCTYIPIGEGLGAEETDDNPWK
jgi:hypothetical protein